MSSCALAHRVTGRPGAPAVVLTGSLGMRRSMWEPQAQALARRFAVVSCDLRGHGDSPVPGGPTRLTNSGAICSRSRGLMLSVAKLRLRGVL